MKRNLLKIICLVLASAILLCGCGGATEQTITSNGMETEATKNGDLLTFTFDSVVDGEDYSYLAAVYEGAEGFWLIQCGSKSADFDKHYNSFLTYLNSVQP